MAFELAYLPSLFISVCFMLQEKVQMQNECMIDQVIADLSNTKELNFEFKCPIWWNLLQAVLAIPQLWRDDNGPL